MSRPRSVGAEHITLEALRFLGLESKWKEIGFNGPQTAAAIGSIIGLCCEPGSELVTHSWLQVRSSRPPNYSWLCEGADRTKMGYW